MKTGVSLALIAVGAILAFAVSGHPGWLDVQAVGWVLMLVGLAGMFIPRRGYGWLRRQVVRRPATSRTVLASHVEDSNVVASNGTALPPGTGGGGTGRRPRGDRARGLSRADAEQGRSGGTAGDDDHPGRPHFRDD